MKRLGKYTKEELVLLTKLYKEGLSIYKIARDLKRSQKSVRNNLIRLGLLEGKIITYRNDVIIDNKKSLINTTNLLLIILLLIPIYLSQKYHEDFGYYHLPYAIGLIEEKIIFGFANIDKPYVYNSIWLNLYSIFFLTDKIFDFLTLPSYLIYLCLILFSFHQIFS